MRANINFTTRTVSLEATGGRMGAVTAAGQTMYWLAYSHPKLVHAWGFEFYPEESARTVHRDFGIRLSDSWSQAADEIAALIAEGPLKTCGHRCDVHEE